MSIAAKILALEPMAQTNQLPAYGSALVSQWAERLHAGEVIRLPDIHVAAIESLHDRFAGQNTQ